MHRFDYLIVCTHDLAVTLTQRPHHLIEYLARMKKKSYFSTLKTPLRATRR